MSATTTMIVRGVLFDFSGTLVEYDSSRREQGYLATRALVRRLGVEIAYPPFLDRSEDTFTSLDRRNAIDHREYSMAEGVSHLPESVLDRPATASRSTRSSPAAWMSGTPASTTCRASRRSSPGWPATSGSVC